MAASYLVIGATSRQGTSVIKSLLDGGLDTKSLMGTCRNPDSASAKALVDLGVSKLFQADLINRESLATAIRESGATRVWFMTDFFSKDGGSRKKEAQMGFNVVDAVKDCSAQVEYVVFTSVGDADNVPQKVHHFWSKADVEKYMEEQFAGTATRWSVIRPVAFLENLDDANIQNPLTKGKVKFLTKAAVPTKFISTVDIGKGSAAMLTNPDEYSGKKIEAATCEHTGTELAEILSEVSGTQCKYGMVLPRIVMWFLPPLWDLYNMVKFFESTGYSADIEAFKKIVPDSMDAKAWFETKGQWANGEKFTSG
eukprot:CAMPEP_0113944120 /NCGR_PEP_ID=MMETSP1339-20121228/30650_1 /TAXON_ID=94617 /ORGANISM="Fibrocapsa japonica" /LENGTH=310 /DNA_ID=CAMNT_0000949195 /DNA_START=59 /DNA_END=991 /DNA_ORIENTATION=- /assembly_acc=CAM_ASM_000762